MIPCNYKLFIPLLCITFFLITASAFAQRDYFGNQHYWRTVELHGELLGNPKVNYADHNINIGQYGLGININAGREYTSVHIEYNYRIINLQNLAVPNLTRASIHEMFVGFKYFPMRPNFAPGNLAIRFTAGGLFGLDVGGDYMTNWRSLFFAGIFVSPFRSLTGLSMYIEYSPGFTVNSYPLGSFWMARLGLIIGPSF